jgi:hypothetical protein
VISRLDQEEAVNDEDLSFKVVKDLGAHDELLALAANLPIARAAYEAAVKMYPGEVIELRQDARVVARSRA